MRKKVVSRALCVGLLLLLPFAVFPRGESEPEPGAFVGETSEAPALHDLVNRGLLPPLAERLPIEPMVVEPHDEIGQYGGTWRLALVGGFDTGQIQTTMGYEHLVRFGLDFETILPNIAKDFKVNADSTEYTFYLREGMKWSDGHPFSADDIMFWYEDVYMNDSLTTVRSGWLTSGADRDPVVVEKVDDFTVVFRYKESNGLLLMQLATVGGAAPTIYPRHYMEQFHKDYNDNIDQLVNQYGYEDWMSLFGSKSSPDHQFRFANSDRPVLTPWQVTTAYGEGPRVVAERNPYYWKVDTEGNQLPYIDSLTYDLTENVEVVLLRAMAGEIDNMHRRFSTATNRPVLAEYAARGDYTFYATSPATTNALNIMLNMNHPDPVKREIFQNRDFRVGLSHAINRPEIIELILAGLGRPHQSAPRPDSRFYHERLSTQYTEYDVALANEYLDRAGYAEKNRDGIRLGPDGRPIRVTFEIKDVNPHYMDVGELVEMYWKAVGVDTEIRVMERTLWETRVRRGIIEYDGTMHMYGGGSGASVILDARYWLPVSNSSLYARAWYSWYSNPESDLPVPPQEPPAEVKRQMRLYEELLKTADPDNQDRLMKEILDISADMFYSIGIATEEGGYGIRKNNFRNFPDPIIESYQWPTPAPAFPEQFFFAQ